MISSLHPYLCVSQLLDFIRLVSILVFFSLYFYFEVNLDSTNKLKNMLSQGRQLRHCVNQVSPTSWK